VAAPPVTRCCGASASTRAGARARLRDCLKRFPGWSDALPPPPPTSEVFFRCHRNSRPAPPCVHGDLHHSPRGGGGGSPRVKHGPRHACGALGNSQFRRGRGAVSTWEGISFDEIRAGRYGSCTHPSDPRPPPAPRQGCRERYPELRTRLLKPDRFLQKFKGRLGRPSRESCASDKTGTPTSRGRRRRQSMRKILNLLFAKIRV
jgi:hypothetical protein